MTRILCPELSKKDVADPSSVSILCFKGLELFGRCLNVLEVFGSLDEF